MEPIETSRSVQEVFDELEILCGRKGYIHVLAVLSFRDMNMSYTNEMTPQAMAESYDKDRTVRTEFSTLLGLMLKSPIDASMQSLSKMQLMIEKTHALLEEMHVCLTMPTFDAIEKNAVALALDGTSEIQNPFVRGDVLREAIFYGGESAYSFQYLDFALDRYAKDEAWLVANKGFRIADGHAVVSALLQLQQRKLTEVMKEMVNLDPSEKTPLPGFTFFLHELTKESALPVDIVEAVLNSLTTSGSPTNVDFTTLGSFNIANALPILRLESDKFISLDTYGVVQALYDSPYYWMADDKKYQSIAFRHRGEFTEKCVAARLTSVFGKTNVYTNVDIYAGKNRICEVDILVLFADRALVIQCKSKKLTLEARKGNDLHLREDFKKSVQHAYDQAFLCATALNDTKHRFVTQTGFVLKIPVISNAYPICVVSDHYPAVTFQARHFLIRQHNDFIQAPLVSDVFFIDVLAEMLSTPLWFLSYIDRRANYEQHIISINELEVLAFHLKQNLWVEEDVDLVGLQSDVAIELDVAMSVRRTGIKGDRNPSGILTKFGQNFVGKILEGIENRRDPVLIDLGLMLLESSGETIDTLNDTLRYIINLARRDGETRDFSIGLVGNNGGLTVYCTPLANTEVCDKLRFHCKLRKYAHRAKNWFGLVVHSGDELPKFGLHLKFPWKEDKALDIETKNMPISTQRSTLPSELFGRKIGRNELCPCGSGKKFKKCCQR